MESDSNAKPAERASYLTRYHNDTSDIDSLSRLRTTAQ